MITLTVDDFSLAQTLECGQVFRFKKIEENHYFIQAQNYIADIQQVENKLLIDSNYENFDFWSNYFDTATPYCKIKNILKKCPEIIPSIEYGEGIHILKQDFSEMLISFIMSQNKQIPQIKQCIELFCEKFGDKIEFKGNIFYGFPKIKKIPEIEEIRACKVGFRDKYILDALTKELSGFFIDINKLPEKVQEEKLLAVKGIGPKVANCILLFGLSRTNRFPIDVWIKKVMQNLFFNGEETPNNKIQEKAVELFGEYQGYAQQYIFYKGMGGVQ